MQRIGLIFATLLFGSLLAAPAEANTIATFSLFGQLLTPGSLAVEGTIDGTFRLDLTDHKILDVSINSTKGPLIPAGNYPGFSADSYTITATGTELVLRTSATAVYGVIGQLVTLNIYTLSESSDLSGTLAYVTTGNEAAFFPLCVGPCALRHVFASTLPISVTTTPIPAALPLLATALGGFGVMGWRRKRQTT